MQRQQGFTIFELVIVLIMVGLLTAGLVPLLTAQHARSMDQDEREALHQARDALISVGINRGGFPAPLNSGATGFDTSFRPSFPTGWVIPANESYLPWNDPNLGVNAFGSYRKYFWYDVRAQLRRDYGTPANPRVLPFEDLNAAPTAQNFCRNARLALAAAAADPRTCRLPAVGEEATPCPGGAAAASPAAITLVSFGSDFVPNMAHANINLLAAPPVRNYENPERGPNRNRTAAPSPFYDDMVASVSLAELTRECERLGHLDQPVGPCGLNQKALVVVNTSGGADGVRLPGPSCISAANNTSLNLGCFVDTAVVTVHNTVANCTASPPINFKGNAPTGTPPTSATLSALDSNNDGTVRFTCAVADATPPTPASACTVN